MNDAKPADAAHNQTISQKLAAFAYELKWEDIPESARESAKHLILDGIGIAFASSAYDFATVTFEALSRFGSGSAVAIGFKNRLPMRDAALLNGVLIHGIDYDDTHTVSVVHPTSSCLPTSLIAAELGLTGKDLLLAYILGVEVSARIGAVAKGELNQSGFHPTGLVAAFGAAVAAGKLYGLNAHEMTDAQGIVLSMASGTREYSTEGAWTKRLHPGWAGVSGITAAVLAKSGFVAPTRAYEGTYGLYATHLGAKAASIDLSYATRALGRKWEVSEVAVKPYPCGQFGISCIDAAIALKNKHQFDPAEIESVEVAIPPHAVAIMLEPLGKRRRPHSSYSAQFSIPFLVSCALTYDRLSPAELELYEKPELLQLADRIGYRVDHATDYPRHFPCEITVILKDGRQIAHNEKINRGSIDRPVSPAEIDRKYYDNMAALMSTSRAESIRDAVMRLDSLERARDFAVMLGAE